MSQKLRYETLDIMLMVQDGRIDRKLIRLQDAKQIKFYPKTIFNSSPALLKSVSIYFVFSSV